MDTTTVPTPAPVTENPTASATPTNGAGVTLTQVQNDADKAVDDGAALATDAINKEPVTTLSADAAAFLKDVEQLGYDEVMTLLRDLVEFKSAGMISSFSGFFAHIGTQIGGLISRL